jgi:hypothetical protein
MPVGSNLRSKRALYTKSHIYSGNANTMGKRPIFRNKIVKKVNCHESNCKLDKDGKKPCNSKWGLPCQ